MSDVALTISNLRIEVAGNGADIVDEVNLTIAPGEVLGLVGESGSGKTTVGLAVLGHARRGVKLAVRRCVDRRGVDARTRRCCAASCTRPTRDVCAAGSVDRAQPGAANRQTNHRGPRVPQLRRQRRGAQGPRGRGDERGRAAQHAGVPSPLPAPTVRRPATTGRAGNGVCVPARGDRARRADHRPRRQHASTCVDHDSRTVPCPQGGRAVRHARPRSRCHPCRSGRGDVCRTNRRAGSCRGAVRQSVRIRTRGT